MTVTSPVEDDAIVDLSHPPEDDAISGALHPLPDPRELKMTPLSSCQAGRHRSWLFWSRS